MKCFVCHNEIAESLFNDNVPPMCSNECHRINFWNEKAEKYAKNENGYSNRVVIVNGGHYTYHDEVPNAYFKGFGGRQFKVKFNDGRVIQTKNMWFQGDIPEEFRDRLSDNAVFQCSDEDIQNTQMMQNLKKGFKTC